MTAEKKDKETEAQRADDKQLDKFTWKRGDLKFVEHGEGPTLAEIERDYKRGEAQRATDAMIRGRVRTKR